MPENSDVLLLRVDRSVMAACGLLPALLFARLWAFSGAGRRPCFYNDKTAASEFQAGINTVRRAFRVLQDSGLVSFRWETVEYGRRKSYSIDLKAYEDLCKTHICSKRTYDQIGLTRPTKMGGSVRSNWADRDLDVNKDKKECVPHSPDGGAETHADPHPAPSLAQVEKEVEAYVKSAECTRPDSWKQPESVRRIATAILNDIVQKRKNVADLPLFVRNAVETWKGIESAMAPRPKPRRNGGRSSGVAESGRIQDGELRGLMIGESDRNAAAIGRIGRRERPALPEKLAAAGPHDGSKYFM